MRALVVLGALLALGCLTAPEKPPFEYLPAMRRSVPYDSFAPNPHFADGKTLQPPVEGTVARGQLPLPYGPGVDERQRAAVELTGPELAGNGDEERGRQLYATFCLVCHGEQGAGDGPIVGPFPPPPAYQSTGIRELSPGHLFHVVTWGTGRMPGYGGQILPEDRWRVVRHVETLQRAKVPR